MQELRWKNKEISLIADCRVFSVYCHMAQAAGREAILDFYVLRLSNWVNVIPVTADQQVVFVKQYRHGIGQVTLEIPGGMIDPHEQDPKQAVERELFEETGYKAKELILLGGHHPNPALQNNVCYTYLAPNVEKISEPCFDPQGYEQIELFLVPLSQVSQLISNGDITHGIVITAFHYLHLYYNKNQFSGNE
jgi:ADP-ribose pyrophosphatase